MIGYEGTNTWSTLTRPEGLIDLVTVASLMGSAQGLADRTVFLRSYLDSGVKYIRQYSENAARGASDSVEGELAIIELKGLFVCQQKDYRTLLAPMGYDIVGTNLQWVNIAVAATANGAYANSCQQVVCADSNGFIKTHIARDRVLGEYDIPALQLNGAPSYASYSVGVSTSSSLEDKLYVELAFTALNVGALSPSIRLGLTDANGQNIIFDIGTTFYAYMPGYGGASNVLSSRTYHGKCNLPFPNALPGTYRVKVTVDSGNGWNSSCCIDGGKITVKRGEGMS